MHELGIVFHIVEMVEELGRENRLSSVTAVNLRLGEVSGVIPEYLQDCWRWAADKSELLHGCELEVETIPAVTVCNHCGRTYPTLEHGKICPFCESPDTVLLQGNEMELDSIVVPEDE
ncbi:MAG: hydrogenase maturation nickel metallochaperone HypA [Atopobiaceae bacterium]|nr:hydrogenase maturation nickel metallochaperone HypA [Atopobiaceae bacterium]